MQKHCVNCTSTTCHHISHFSILLGALAFAVVATGLSGIYLVRQTTQTPPIANQPEQKISTPRAVSNAHTNNARTTLTILEPATINTALNIAP